MRKSSRPCCATKRQSDVGVKLRWVTMVHLAGCDAGMCVYRETGQCDTIMWMAQRHTLRTSGLARDVASSTICWCSVFLLPSVKALRPICLTHAPRTDEIGTVSNERAYHMWRRRGEARAEAVGERVPTGRRSSGNRHAVHSRKASLASCKSMACSLCLSFGSNVLCADTSAKSGTARTHARAHAHTHTHAHPHTHTLHTQCTYD